MHPGNQLFISGGFKSQRERILDVMSFCIDELLPLHRTIDINITVGNYEATENVMGQCLHVDGNEFQIDIDGKQKLYDLILTVCHEMVHVKQYARKELQEAWPKTMWYGKSYSDQRSLPWELEAWKLQKELAHRYIKQAFDEPIKAIKVLDKRS
jgi:hypothetical protein